MVAVVVVLVAVVGVVVGNGPTSEGILSEDVLIL